jgi:hypothetical protein
MAWDRVAQSRLNQRQTPQASAYPRWRRLSHRCSAAKRAIASKFTVQVANRAVCCFVADDSGSAQFGWDDIGCRTGLGSSGPHWQLTPD